MMPRAMGCMMAPLMSPPASVEVHGLVHDYGPRRALRGVDFEVGSGQIFGLLGPNGGGKTTLFRILTTLIRPTAGRASVLGNDVALRPREARAAIGVVFQSPALDRKLTTRENLETQGRLYGLGGRALREAVDAMLLRVRLADRASDRVETLSGGLMRRAEIAKGILHRPRLLLLDEPSLGLAPLVVREFFRIVRDLNEKEGLTVLVTEQNANIALQAADNAYVLEVGRVALSGPSADLQKDESVRKSYLGY